MKKYIVKRLLLFIPTLLGTSLFIFLLLRVVPGDVAAVILAGPSGEGHYTPEAHARLREQLGLDKHILVQYVDWMWDVARGDLGKSFISRRDIASELKLKLPITIQLALFSFISVAAMGIPIGVLAAVRQDSWIDFVLRGWAILGLAMPTFLVGLLVILFLSVEVGWMPPLGFTHLWQNPVVSTQQLIVPAIALGFSSNGLLLRMTRTQMLEVMRDDYVRTARAKGLGEAAVIWRHALRNALLPVVTTLGGLMGGLLTGTVVIELIFSVPGVGQALVQAIVSRDLAVVQVYVLYFALMALIVNLIVDITYAWLDPRIRYE